MLTKQVLVSLGRWAVWSLLLSLSLTGCGGPWERCAYEPRQTPTAPTPELTWYGDCVSIRDDGTVAIEPGHLSRMDFSPPTGLASLRARGGSYYVRPDGTAILVLTFDNGPDYFSEGLARIERAGRIGYINPELEVVIEPTYDFALPFSGGHAEVCNGCTFSVPDGDGHRSLVGGRWGCIDANGLITAPLELTREEVASKGCGGQRTGSR